jgi:deoxyribodipyrimidine photolyase-related protein
MTHNLILVMGDQLSLDCAALRAGDMRRDRVLMVEVMEEARTVPHHKKKLVFIFSAMRHFAATLRAEGWAVDYITLDDPENQGGFSQELARACARHAPAHVLLTAPSEWRVAEMAAGWQAALALPVTILPDDRFLCSPQDFAAWAAGRKRLRMEYFYREMRRKTGLLMQGDTPEGGKWNYDSENRKPPSASLFLPTPYAQAPDAETLAVIAMVERHFPDNFGEIMPFGYAVTQEGAQAALAHFIAHSLPHFGDYQDAMLEGAPFLYHAVIGLYLNTGLLAPLAVCQAVEAAYQRGHTPLNAVEGFIRQIIGWREYIRGIYGLKMPSYAQENFFQHSHKLPDFYWSGETDMACLRAAIGQTRQHAYAHHIQRLMVTGNFAMLAGVDPHEVHLWYLAVYADAFEWVELPNTMGMSQFADGGILASKPYAASGAYINRMSNYCGGCAYDVKQRTGERACPFNALYWDFLARHRGKIGGNPRMAQMLRTYDRFSDEEQQRIRASAAATLIRLNLCRK